MSTRNPSSTRNQGTKTRTACGLGAALVLLLVSSLTGDTWAKDRSAEIYEFSDDVIGPFAPDAGTIICFPPHLPNRYPRRSIIRQRLDFASELVADINGI